jgi:hypothetical protein
LRVGEPVDDESLDRVGGPVHVGRQVSSLRHRERLQHEDRRIHPVRRAADPEPDPKKVACAWGSAHPPQAVVAVVPTAALHPQRAVGQVELVVHHHKIVDVDAKKLRRLAIGPADSFL